MARKKKEIVKKKPVGAPRKYSDEDIEAIRKELEIYIKETNMPIIAEFALRIDVPRTTLYDLKGLSSLLKKAITKAEVFLQKAALANKVNVTFAIFKLKQRGFDWTDKKEVEHSGEVKHKLSLADLHKKAMEYEEQKKLEEDSGKDTD